MMRTAVSHYRSISLSRYLIILLLGYLPSISQF
jgi:hypothetical protein